MHSSLDSASVGGMESSDSSYLLSGKATPVPQAGGGADFRKKKK